MIHFECDYACGAADVVLQAIIQSNDQQTSGYGEDERCARATALILNHCQNPKHYVHFVVGGTQANLLVIAAALRPFEGVLCADTGHINVHETGAVEATGHKVLPLPGKNGKITAEQVRKACLEQAQDSAFEHIVRPGMVYISHPTEVGTLYTKDELQALSDTCRELDIPLYLDGARLGYGLAAMPEVDLPFLCRVCDAFTIGGTKVGLFFGEAIVLTKPSLHTYFRYHIKQRGAMLAKGRLLGVQFEAMMRDDNYVSLSARANALAQEIKQAFVQKGCTFFSDTITNQVFPIVPNDMLAKLGERFVYSTWAKVDENRTAVRFCTNVTTPREDVDDLLSAIQNA